MKTYLDIHPEVESALSEGRPVVALESTIISHGMPYPQNVQMANKVEQIIRDGGAVPATIAILDGRMKVGLTPDDLELLATHKDVKKVSRRDMGIVIAKKYHGATTVATTMYVASLAGINTFVTGGIGGVHRDGQNTFDISADLMELAQTSVAVVCAGAKSILDIGLTLEYLETHGVPVIGLDTDIFPAFYTAQSEFGVDANLNPVEVAASMKAKWDIGLSGGLVIANPIPKEHAMDEKMIAKAIEDALKEADENGIKGKKITPFLLGKIKDITEGKSLEANLALVYNNAKKGAEIAVAYAELNR
ncbi:MULTISPECIES: pseudouridine-5'-phosphate glycosidase [unclassified Fusibacter]|uniref:pseudouridine-5'-phosphate glycosidase n=1 Tax=unclassified Fusibacter TaxID=2624464 RepID=UPI0010107A7A|nr:MULTISPECIES: pseudouridine-5'-phosphate glycosidase [unclassified Fusibacter]MCK8060532.1 pseudouridine-5'-phosphate glycosidase [Fusibacter sp. A2]NPE23014.1 pseudouridine-5'-phosphate glycosidase [Fusibacter sp. A1]RXV60079.1 pseudouridine-5'-phosphate glycosidase [Fusibacter sp. A1]